MLKFSKELVLIFTPFLLKYVFLLIFIDFGLLAIGDFIEDIIFSSLISILLFSSIGKIKLVRQTLLFFYVLYFILETVSYLAVSSNFTSSFMYILIESSKGELNEFVNSYFKLEVVFFIILSLLFLIVLSRKKYMTNKYLSFVITSISILLIIAFLKLTGLIERNAYYNIVRGVYGYFEMQDNFELSKQSISSDDIEITSDNDLFVLIIGESTNRNHMQLYGYNKNTTPKLSEFKDSIYVYNDVISTDVLTSKAIPKALTSMEGHSSKKPIRNIIEIFNNAGFKSYWLSNQRPISYHDNAINEIASMSNSFKFYNFKVDKDASVLDEVMLPDYKSILNEKGKKIIIFRLIGTHFSYNKRYPVSFNKFKPSNKTERETVRSYYHNAVLYNDFIVYSILDDLKKLNKKSALVYFSDHGENVFDDGDFFGRNEANIKSSMFEIPFLLWTSESFEKPLDFEYSPNRKFMTDHLYESLGHLLGVKYKDMKFGKSIFSKNFKERERIIVNGVDFDKYFSN